MGGGAYLSGRGCICLYLIIAFDLPDYCLALVHDEQIMYFSDNTGDNTVLDFI